MFMFILCAGSALAGGDGRKATPAAPAPARPQHSTVEVRCRSQALVRGVDVRLHDVAEVIADDPALAQRLGEVSFGRRPARGFNRVLPQSGVASQLALEGLAPEQVRLTGAAETIVQSVHANVPPSELIEVAEPILRAAIELEAERDIEFELGTKLAAIEVPPGRASFDLRGRLRGNTLQASSALVEVAVVVDGEEFKVVALPYRLKRYAKALVVSEPVRRETPLGAHVLEERRIEIAPGAQTTHVADVAAVTGTVAARDLRRGQVLRLGDLAQPAVIRPKDPVVVVIARGRVQVTTKGLALGNAARGERVDVVTAAGRVLQGIAQGASLVTIGMGTKN
jgi:flagella basal body P-ring formation protein FlgA